MTTLRVGTRGSDLALWQTQWVCRKLKAIHASLEIEEIIIKTHGDTATTQPFDQDWPVGGFVGAIEHSLTTNQIDFAIHSFKDLQTQQTEGLTISAIPGREIVNDILVTREPTELSAIGAGFKIGTSSPRRIAQFRRFADVEIVPIRGNVPTRIRKLETDGLDGVVLAGAGVKRLGLSVGNSIDLPTEPFLPAPAQGALAIQSRTDSEADRLIAHLDDPKSRRTITAERAFLRAIGAGCHTPVGALACLDGENVQLRGQLFSDDGSRVAEGIEEGDDPTLVGKALAARLLAELQEAVA